MKIVVLGGGISTERHVSLVSATSVCKALRSRGHKAIFVDMFFGLEDYDGTLEQAFDEPDGFCGKAEIEKTEPDIKAVIDSRKLKSLSHLGDRVLDICALADCVFLGLHGQDGEDGKIQATLELLGIPYTGSDHLSSAMAMDKAVTKKIMNSCGVLTPGSREIYYTADDIERLSCELPMPCVLKDPCGGSSIGVCLPETREELKTALEDLLRYGDRVLVEDRIVGREMTQPVLDGEYLDTIEIVPPEGNTFDYVAKYQSGSAAAQEICPARITPEEHKLMGEAALRLHNALGLSVYSRTDFILDKDGRAWCLEVNTLPGMTPASLIPKAAARKGYDYAALCEKVIELSMRERNRK